MEKKWYLDRINIFAELSDEDNFFLVHNSVRKQFAKGQLIFSSSDAGNTVYLIEDGTVKVYDLSESGKESIFWFRYAGEFFGLAEALGGESRSCFAEAVEPSIVFIIRREIFEEMLKRSPKIALITIKILSARLRRLGEALKAHHSQNLRGRVAQLLLNLGGICGTDNCGKISIEKKFTHQDLADMIGATRQRVTETLNDFAKEGLIKCNSKKLFILDSEGLSSKTDSSS